MRRSLLVLLLVSCVAPATPVVSPIESVAPPPAPAVAPAATVARVVALQQELCSDAGGLHVFFEVLDADGVPVAVAHWGGHAYGADQRFCVGDRFTVDYVEARNPDAAPLGWCLEGLPRFDGEVTPLRWLGGPIQPQVGDQLGGRPRCAGVQ